MPLAAPDPAQEPIDPELRAAFERANARWERVRPDVAQLPGFCPTRRSRKARPAIAAADRWLAFEFPKMVLDLARRVEPHPPGRAALLEAVIQSIVATKLDYAHVAWLTSQGVQRREACAVITQFLEPLLNPSEYGRWLGDMAHAQWFWPTAEVNRAQLRERMRATSDFENAIAQYNRRRLHAPSSAESGPTAPALDVPPDVSKIEARNREALGRAGTGYPFPLVVYGNRVAPAHLFISHVGVPAAGYLTVLEPVLRAAAAPFGLAGVLRGVTYGMLALALAPVYCLYDVYHGTCTVEHLLPALGRSIAVMSTYTRRSLRVSLESRLRGHVADDDEARLVRLFDAFAAFGEALGDATRRKHDWLLRVAADQGGGRVRTPLQFSGTGVWAFEIPERPQDAVSVERSVPELLGYEPIKVGKGRIVSSRDHNEEIFWILPAVWQAIGSAVALCNQAGMRVWFNAANNRWGGKHPPHDTHRQGTSVDIDVGFGWRSLTEVHKVQNVMKRDRTHSAFHDYEVPNNSRNADCLHGVERLAGWIVTQAFILAGVRDYLYGDWALVEEAAAHLAGHFDINRPARLEGRVDAVGHNDHWHFEMLVGPRSSGVDPYVWQVPDPELLSHLHELAVQRDTNPSLRFWQQIAGPRLRQAVPSQPSDFDDLPDAKDWRDWWRWRDETRGGIPLLPVWSQSAEAMTRGSQTCKKVPEGDFPGTFSPGAVPG